MAPSPSTLDRIAVIVGTGSSGGLADGDPISAPRPNTELFRKAVRGSRRTRIPSRRSLEYRCFEYRCFEFGDR